MTLLDLLLALTTIALLEVVWLLLFRGRKAPLGYLVINRDELGQWHFRWEKGGD